MVRLATCRYDPVSNLVGWESLPGGLVMAGYKIALRAEDFAALELFAGEKELCEVLSSVGVGYEFDAGSEVLAQNGDGSELFIILSGRVRVNMVASTGRQITYQLLDAGELFGELGSIDGGGRSAAVVTEMLSRVAILRQKDVQMLLRNHHAFVQILLHRLARLARWLGTKVFEYHMLNVKGRVYTELVRAASDAGDWRVVGISDRDMASRVGTTRENVTRIYSDLRRKKIIERDVDGVHLLDVEALETLIQANEFG